MQSAGPGLQSCREARRLTLRSRGRPNGMAHWPSSAGPAAHFALAVQCAMPSCSPLTQTLGSTQISASASQSSGTPAGDCFAPAIESKVRTTSTPPCHAGHTRKEVTSCHIKQRNGRARLARQLGSASAALTSFGVRGKRRLSTSILEGEALAISPTKPSHSPKPTRAQASLWYQRLDSAMLGAARQKLNAKFSVTSFQGNSSTGALFKLVSASPSAA
jgi:hypothetical protein